MKNLVLEDYQRDFVQLILSHPKFGVFLRVGAGKTLIMLESLRILFNQKKIKKVLILAPKHVIHNAWVAEIEKWDYDFSYHVATGEGLKRIPDVQIYVASNDVVRSKFYSNFILTTNPDTIVVDESSRYRNHNSLRTKRLLQTCLSEVKIGRTVVGFAHRTKRLYLLSATPAPNHIENLFTQGLLLDGGKTLGKTITEFRREYCYKSGSFHKYTTREDKLEALFTKMRHISRSCKLLNFTKPRMIYTKIEETDSEKSQDFKKRYGQLKHNCLIEINREKEERGDSYIAFSLPAKFTKLRQVCSGVLYEKQQNAKGEDVVVPHIFGTPKLEALSRLIDDLEGRPLLVAYNYSLECATIERLLQNSGIAYAKITGQMSVKKVSDIIERWNARKLKVLLGHPAAMGHGLNLQHGGSDMLWYSPTLDYELYLQTNGRLDRKGQKEQVIIRHFIVKGTIEGMIYAKLSNKEKLLTGLLEHIKH